MLRLTISIASRLLVQMIGQRAAAAAAGHADERDADAVEHARHRGIDRPAPARLARSSPDTIIRRAMPCRRPATRRDAVRQPRAELARQERLQEPARHDRRAEQRPGQKSRANRERSARAVAVRGTRFATTWRPMSTSRPYLTPDGHVVSHERQVRQRSRWSCVFCGRLAAFQHLLDEIDAPARAVELVAQQLVGRTGRGAESAVHARAQDRVGLVAVGRVADEVGERGLHEGAGLEIRI